MEDNLERLIGVVVSLKANYLEVELDSHYFSLLHKSSQINDLRSYRFLCTRRSRLNHHGTSVYVGDRVWVEAIDFTNLRGVVSDVEPRKSYLSRPAVANITDIVVVISLKNPSFDINQVSRFLITAEQTDLNISVVLSKRDLVSSDYLKKQQIRLKQWGYQPFSVSLRTFEGLLEFQNKFINSEVSVLCGPSGVGKSSLLNYLVPQANQKVDDLSGRLQRGKHTTRHVELFQLSTNSYLVDTPGFNRPELPKDPNKLAFFFPELREQLKSTTCRFRNCLHLDEPGCKVDKSWERYILYCNFLHEINTFSRWDQVGSN